MQADVHEVCRSWKPGASRSHSDDEGIVLETKQTYSEWKVFIKGNWTSLQKLGQQEASQFKEISQNFHVKIIAI